ncbi:hypothetical protein [Chamaesiphon minutus]|uniref:Uncharacterized protein n=1 Tax=Chamaesiphon minutus (strain ATCC 27169 / PCC 6605) TaxID=1173020 RepID=K9UL91_CHAP6|nr:hypothetical protein [Chamaesiphon minutus]AFY95852.1 hypothetical protein Cha6605_4944 [Chamaesiphon minutus PCC 6605]
MTTVIKFDKLTQIERLNRAIAISQFIMLLMTTVIKFNKLTQVDRLERAIAISQFG